MFDTQGEAKRFFVDKVIQQAGLERLALSGAERGMLSWSETDPELTLTPEEADALVRQLELEISDEQYESKIRGLLARAHKRDVASDPENKTVWKEAYSKLNEGDHYIALKLEESLGRKLRRGWFF